MKNILKIFLTVCLLWLGERLSAQNTAPSQKVLGMYMHQHWSYKHPYAVRTWTFEDWQGYVDGLHRLGFNSILIWPMLEIMPEPLTPSDEANLAKIARVIDMVHRDYQMKVSIVLCPNVSPRSEEGRKYSFEDRPFFHTDDRVDPGDPVAFGKLMAWREKLFAPLKEADGLYIIDSDPGGYPHSTNMEFVYILGAHRRMLDHLRKGIEIDYWAHFGWEAYGRFYATGELKKGEPAEPLEAISLIAKQHYEPWGIATSGFDPAFANGIGEGGRVVSFPYGAIEGEPSFPFTIFGGDRAYNGGKNGGQKGVMGNAQTHVVQLPNTFAFAMAAQGKKVEKADYIAFANDLVTGQGNLIVEGWEALQGSDVGRMNAIIKKLSALKPGNLQGGPLKGLLFNDPGRFIEDLVLQLRMASTMYAFKAVVDAGVVTGPKVKKTFAPFVAAAEAWQQRHGYSNHWSWPPMQEALRKLNSDTINATLNTLTFVSEEGATPFDKVKNGLARMESFTPRLIASMKQTLADMEKPATK